MMSVSTVQQEGDLSSRTGIQIPTDVQMITNRQKKQMQQQKQRELDTRMRTPLSS